MVPQVTVTYIQDGRRRSYDAPALSPFDMARAALAFMDVKVADSFEQFAADLEVANAFASFCVNETALPDTPEWCDPTRSFRDLYALFLKETSNA